jgi:hypothetical protein
LLLTCPHGNAQKFGQCLAFVAFQIELLAGHHLHVIEAGFLYLIGERRLRDDIGNYEPSAGVERCTYSSFNRLVLLIFPRVEIWTR